MIKMNKNKEYRLKRKVQRKDYIIQDKNLTIKTLYYRNETKRNKIDQLQQENQQLKEKINTYEDPEDITLMFMYCDEKAKDKIKQLKEVIKEVRVEIKDLLSHWKGNDLVERDLNELLEILDKAKGE